MSAEVSSCVPARIDLHRVRAELLAPHRSAHGAETVREVILVEWTPPDGPSGWAECPTLSAPGYVTETTDAAWAALLEEFVPALLAGREPQRNGCLAAPAALADARLDAWLRSTGTSLAAHLGATRDAMPRCAVLAAVGAAPERLVQAAQAAVAAGAAMVKLKVRPGDDIAGLDAVLGALDVPVAADANGSYSSIQDLRDLDALGLAYLEQPLAGSTDLAELARLRRTLRTPIALDESLTSVDAVATALEAEVVDVVSIKPARLGGIEGAVAAAIAARSAGASVFVGGMVELGIGRAGAAAIAAMTECDLPTDLGPSAAYFERDVCAPLTLDGSGRLKCPVGAGIGRVPDPDALGAMTVGHWAAERSSA